MKKAYISGPITNNANFQHQFAEAEKALTKQGYKVMNPAILPEGFTHEEYMHICYSMIDVCEEVYMLQGWENSKGANLEREYALKNGKKVIIPDCNTPIEFFLGLERGGV